MKSHLEEPLPLVEYLLQGMLGLKGLVELESSQMKLLSEELPKVKLLQVKLLQEE